MGEVKNAPYILECGKMEEVLKGYPDNSIDSVVTDDPYGIKFMGKKWDYDVPSVAQWQEVLRVLKPGGHLVAFGGSKTFHRVAVNIEDAGFEIRDTIMWLYGSGFPKSFNVSKAIDKAAGAEREVIGEKKLWGHNAGSGAGSFSKNQYEGQTGEIRTEPITAPATDLAKQWNGWGTALKPSHEPIILARKPLEGTVAENLEQWGVGAINIDGCRIPLNGDYKAKANGRPSMTGLDDNYDSQIANIPDDVGRFPANLIHDGSEEVLENFPSTKSGKPGTRRKPHETNAMAGRLNLTGEVETGYGDSGSVARFFYCAKANKKDRDEGLEEFEKKFQANAQFRPNHLEDALSGDSGKPHGRYTPRANNHPTVKPTALMRYLCRLVTPKGGLILDPFMGSGSTGKAAMYEGFEFIGIDMVEDYIKIAEARILFAYENREHQA